MAGMSVDERPQSTALDLVTVREHASDIQLLQVTAEGKNVFIKLSETDFSQCGICTPHGMDGRYGAKDLGKGACPVCATMFEITQKTAGGSTISVRKTLQIMNKGASCW